MKNVLFIGALLLSMSGFAADICTNQEGSVVYESATTVGNAVIITNPRLKLAQGEAYIDGFEQDSGTRFCRALGMTSGARGDVTQKPHQNDLVVAFDQKGNVQKVGSSVSAWKLDTVTCQK